MTLQHNCPTFITHQPQNGGLTFVAYHICVSIFLALFPKMAPIPKKTMKIAIGITPTTIQADQQELHRTARHRAKAKTTENNWNTKLPEMDKYTIFGTKPGFNDVRRLVRAIPEA